MVASRWKQEDKEILDFLKTVVEKVKERTTELEQLAPCLSRTLSLQEDETAIEGSFHEMMQSTNNQEVITRASNPEPLPMMGRPSSINDLSEIDLERFHEGMQSRNTQQVITCCFISEPLPMMMRLSSISILSELDLPDEAIIDYWNSI